MGGGWMAVIMCVGVYQLIYVFVCVCVCSCGSRQWREREVVDEMAMGLRFVYCIQGLDTYM